MRTSLRLEGLWSIINDGYTKPSVIATLTLSLSETKELENSRISNAKALTRIKAAVDPSIFHRIITDNTTKEAWNTLEIEFQGDVLQTSSNLGV